MKNLIVNVSRTTRMVSLPENFISVDGENLQSNLVFKFTDEFVDGQARLECKVGSDKNYFVLNKTDEEYSIPIKNVITKEGKITMQLVVTEGTEEEEIPVFKSNVFYLYCNESINAVTEAPDGYDLWIEVANAKINEMDEALAEVDNLDITAERVSDGVEVSITDKEGTTATTKINDGEDAKINGYNTLTIEAGTNIDIEQEDNTLTISNTFTESDPVFSASASANITSQDITNWNDKAEVSDIPDVSNFITKSVNDLTNYYLKSETYTQTEVNNLVNAISTMTLEVVQELPTQDISTTTIYLVPKSTAETNDSYDEYVYISNNWEHIGSTDVDLSGYQTKIDSTHKLDADLVDDTNSTNKFVTASDKTTWGNKYDKPLTGIPSTDLSSAVQTSLGKADTALQSETYTGTITSVKMNGTTVASSGEADLGTVITDISGKQDVIDSSHKLSADLISDGSTNKTVTATEKTTWSGKQDALVSGTNIKTINSTSILGSGNIETEIIQYSTMPTASASTVGKIVQFTGTTDSTYTNGYFYKGTSTESGETTTYSWQNLNVQPGGSGGSDLPSNFDFYNISDYFSSSSISWNSLYTDIGEDGYGILFFDIEITTTLTNQDVSPTYNESITVPKGTVAEISTSGTNRIYITYIKDGISYKLQGNKFLGNTWLGNIYTGNRNITGPYKSNATYNEGDYVIYNGKLYKCNTTISVAEAWDSSHWTATTVATELSTGGSFDPTTVSGYDATANQTLSNEEGTLTWQDGTIEELNTTVVQRLSALTSLNISNIAVVSSLPQQEQQGTIYFVEDNS